MSVMPPALERLSDRELLARVEQLASNERQATADLVASLAELDERRLYLSEGFSSLFSYCTVHLHLSEHAAYLRIEAARAARRFPAILEQLRHGTLHLTAIGLLRSHLTEANHLDVLAAACHKSKREVEELVARLAPRPDVAPTVRKLPDTRRNEARDAALTVEHRSPPMERRDTGAITERKAEYGTRDQPMPTSRATRQESAEAASHLRSAASCDAPPALPRPTASAVQPLAPERFKVQLTIGSGTLEKLRRVQDLLRHVAPDGDLELVFDRAVTALLAQLERERLAAVAQPRELAPGGSTRSIPAAVRRAVWTRDQGRCAFVGRRGRCRETGLLEFHHVMPFAAGGQPTADNVELRCRAHNGHEATLFFGEPTIKRARGGVVGEPGEENRGVAEQGAS